MIQNAFFRVIFFVVATFILVPTHIEAKCNICSDYGIACFNETSFNICSGGVPRTNQVFTCPSNTLCTATNLKCVTRESGGKPDCEPNKGCDICDGKKIFACTSRTTFAQCNGKKLTKNIGTCPEGLICSSESGEICKDECNRPATIECDRAKPI